MLGRSWGSRVATMGAMTMAALTILSGCNNAGSPTGAASPSAATATDPTPVRSGSTPSPTTTGPAKAIWHLRDAVPLSNVISAPHGVGVYFAKTGGSAHIRAIDVRTGRVRWSKPIAPSASIGTPVVVGTDVVYFAPTKKAKPERGVLTFADATSGKVTKRADTPYVPSSIFRCLTGTDAACTYSHPADGSAEQDLVHRMTAHSDDVTALPGENTNFAFSGKNVERFEGHANKPVWSKPLKSLFPKSGSAKALGYAHDPVSGVQLLSLGPATKASIPASSVRAVGVDAATGRVLWRRSGVSFSCGTPDLDQRGFGLRSHAEILPMCRWTAGTLTGDGFTPKARGLKYDVVGLNVRTGTIVWSVAAGSTSSTHITLSTNDNGRSFFMTHHGQATVVDVATGKTTAVGPAYQHWKPRAGTVPLRFAGRSVRTTLELTVPYTRSTPDSIIRRPVPDAMGATAGDVHAIALHDEVVGVR